MWSIIDTDFWLLEETNNLSNKVYALDTETTGLSALSDELLLIQVKAIDEPTMILDVRKLDQGLVALFMQRLFDVAETVILHNAKFDIKFIMQNYNSLPRIGSLYDTQIAEGILFNGLQNKYASLKELAEKYLGEILEKDTRLEFVGYSSDTFSIEQLEYSAKDVDCLFGICSAQQYFLLKNDLLDTARIEFDLVPAVSKMELEGVYLDTDRWLAIYEENIKHVESARNKLQELASKIEIDYFNLTYKRNYHYNFAEEAYNPNSSHQSLAILSAYYGCKIDSTNSKVLATLHNEFADALLEYREYGKATSTYGVNFLENINPVTGRIHATFNQMGTYSGRFSTDSPNTQNIPREKRYRDCFVAPYGRKLITSDYSQIELRLAGEMSGDEMFINAYKNKEDLHQITADIINRPRHDGKTLNFSILYGASPYRVKNEFGIPLDEAEEVVYNWRNGFPKLDEFIEELRQSILNTGYSKTMSGRRRYFDMPMDNSKESWSKRNAYLREGVNHPIQGTSADMIKIAITNIFYRLFYYDAFVVNTVHDEIIVECEESIADAVLHVVEEEMIKAGERFLKIIPVVADAKIGDVWGH